MRFKLSIETQNCVQVPVWRYKLVVPCLRNSEEDTVRLKLIKSQGHFPFQTFQLYGKTGIYIRELRHQNRNHVYFTTLDVTHYYTKQRAHIYYWFVE